MVVPDDATLLTALTALRGLEPTMSAAKIRQQLKSQHGWSLSGTRLKEFMRDHNLGTRKIRNAEFDKVVQAFFDEYTGKERDIINSFSQMEIDRIMSGPQGLETKAERKHVLVTKRSHISILLTLKGIKPCTIYCHGNMGPYTRIVNEALRPLMHKYTLEMYGFTLRQVTKAVSSKQGEQYGPRNNNFWLDSWIFADTLSPMWTETQELFLPLTDAHWMRGERLALEDTIDRICGCPVPFPREIMATDQNAGYIKYSDVTEGDFLTNITGGKNFPVIGFEFNEAGGEAETWATIMEHFEQCRCIAESVGTRLVLNLAGHEPLQDYADDFYDAKIASEEEYWKNSSLELEDLVDLTDGIQD